MTHRLSRGVQERGRGRARRPRAPRARRARGLALEVPDRHRRARAPRHDRRPRRHPRAVRTRRLAISRPAPRCAGRAASAQLGQQPEVVAGRRHDGLLQRNEIRGRRAESREQRVPARRPGAVVPPTFSVPTRLQRSYPADRGSSTVDRCPRQASVKGSIPVVPVSSNTRWIAAPPGTSRNSKPSWRDSASRRRTSLNPVESMNWSSLRSRTSCLTRRGAAP